MAKEIDGGKTEAALDAREREILDFERGWWREPGPKALRIRDGLGLSVAHYHQLLNRLIDRPEALAYDPMLVRRLRRLRDARRRRRVAGRLGRQV
ncbi:MAG: DUF3263 domain-containing protein [Actinobacteria bacterium]|nr:DUF3263 domain-containing protein [Actinomycetota bacterium]